MKLDQLLDRDKLAWHLAQKNISARCHPFLDLTVLNYTHKCMYDAAWDETTTKCRGLVYNDDFDIVARPWPKWWNFSDPKHPETMPENLPKSQPEITEKLDGFLIIGFLYDGREVFASRGSFTSDHAKWATGWFREHPCVLASHGETYLFEGLTNKLRIVLRYGEEAAPLLAVIDNATGQEWGYDVRKVWGQVHGWPVVETYHDFDVSALAKQNRIGHEGYVVSWLRRDGPSLKIKIKHEEYQRLHRLTFSLTDHGVWAILREGGLPQEQLRDPDPELKQWVIGVENRLADKYLELARPVNDFIRATNHTPDSLQVVRANRELRADFAALVKKHLPEQLQSGAFALAFDGQKAFEEWLWKQVEPHPKTFYRQEVEE